VSPDVLKFILQVVAIAFGGGTVQLLIFLLRKRGELRNLDTQSDVNVSTASATLISRLQEDGATYREIVKGLQDEISLLKRRRDQEQLDFAQRLQDAHSENTRLTTKIAQLQTDLDIAQRHIEELRRMVIT
jgi:uncharacterized protein (DUF342 family)